MRESADGHRTRAAILAGEEQTLGGGVEERHHSVRRDAADRKAAVRSRAAREEAAEVGDLDVVVVPLEIRTVGGGRGVGRLEVMHVGAVVGCKEEAEGPRAPRGSRSSRGGCSRAPPARCGCRRRRLRARRPAGRSIDRTRNAGAPGRRAKVEGRDELRVGEQDARQTLVERRPRRGVIGKRKLGLDVLHEARAEAPSESPVDTDRPSRLDVTHDLDVGVRVGAGLRDEQRVHVDLGPDEERGARLDEARLAQLGAQVLLGQELERRRRRGRGCSPAPGRGRRPG